MLRISALFLAFLAPAATQMSSNLEGRQISITRQSGSSVVIPCDIVDQNTNYVHWYRYQEGMAPRRLLYYEFSSSQFVVDQGVSSEKYHVYEGTGRSCKFVLRNLEEKDSGVYYCAVWTGSGWIKIFAEGTKLIVTAPDRNFGPEFSPKPTIFLPSMAEINLQNAGTYLCLLENFFPDVIKVHWKEKNSNTILESQQGTTMKTNDTYMKFSWLTLTANSMNKEHKCIVRHENNVNGVDQEILFPSMKKEVDGNNPTEKACLTDQSGTLQLQLISTSAYYTYLLLLLKSVVYFAIITFCLFKRTAVCGDGVSNRW